uniref:Uncharacterized protein n=1 Tax=Pseudomonas marincola TaxID=437900 RepID=A0A653E004_9PSED
MSNFLLTVVNCIGLSTAVFLLGMWMLLAEYARSLSKNLHKRCQAWRGFRISGGLLCWAYTWL